MIRRRIPLRRRRDKRRLPAGLARHRQHERDADKLWAILVKSQSELCQRCGMRRATDAHHLISRRYRQTRWLDVGAAICKGCHMVVTYDGEANRELALRLLGAERYEQLLITRLCLGKVDPLAAAVALHARAKERRLV